MGSEKSADQAWDFVSSWFVISLHFIGLPKMLSARPIQALSAKYRPDPLTLRGVGVFELISN